MKKSVLNMMAFALIVTGAKPAMAISAEEIIFGIGGALFGNALCRAAGASRDLAAFCGLGGALIAAEAARQMNEQDAREFNRAQDDAFRGEINSPYDWDASRYGSRSGVRGRIYPYEEGYHYSTYEVCRRYRSTTYYGRNKQETKETIVCRRNNGTIYTLETVNYYRAGRYVGGQTNEEIRPGRRPGRGRPNPPRYEEERPRPVPVCDGWNTQNLRRGDIVYTRNGWSANYQGYNSYNDTIAVLQSGFNQVYSAGDVAIQGCHFGIASGTVMSTRYDTGTVRGIFRNGDVAIEARGWIRIVRMNELYR